MNLHPPTSVLLINDLSSNSEKVRAALATPGGSSFNIEELHRLEEGLERIRHGEKIGAVLLSPFLPDSQGIETVKRLLEAAPDTPLVVLGEEDQEEFAMEAVDCGAQDYILPDHLDNYSLPRALRNAVERKSIEDALYVEKDRALVTLNSIGDAVLCTDISGKITFLNPVAEKFTGWGRNDAEGRPLAEVFNIIDGKTGERALDPLKMAIEENRAVGLTPDCILVRRDGARYAIEDSAAPIHDRANAVIGAVIVFHDVTAARAMASEMAQAAQHDQVTSLPNRILFGDRICCAITSARRRRKPFAVMFLDLDHFKSINDTLGHAVGDKLLQAVAKRLQGSVRESDTVARHGGDEFVILLSEIEKVKDAKSSAAKILTALSRPYIIDELTLRVRGTIGISIYPQDGTDAKTLLQNADMAMYEAKASGRDTAQFFNEEMKLQATEQQFVEVGLRRALEQNEFVLHYQPKVDLVSGKITGAEALIRWLEPVRGLIMPNQFIPIAESRGLIISIGRWVLREVCKQTSTWKAAGCILPPISINVSAAELHEANFVRIVRTALADSGIPAESIQFELTEGILLRDVKSSNAVIRDLKDLGVNIAVDDFGTGYSSLSYLHQFAIDVLKIDQSFVGRITDNPEDSNLVGAIIGMAKKLKYRVVAEGVETEKQRAFLAAQGCDEGQGYLFSRPVPPAEFFELCRKYPRGQDGRTLVSVN
jgi:diguanylate cyclase (GGDEF)-like protein/PAS domain S-box-containing protein